MSRFLSVVIIVTESTLPYNRHMSHTCLETDKDQSRAIKVEVDREGLAKGELTVDCPHVVASKSIAQELDEKCSVAKIASMLE